MSGARRSQRVDPGLQAAGAANDFLAVYLTDCAAGRERSLADYQRMFPGHDAAIAAEFAALNAEFEEEPLPTIPQVTIEAVIGRGGQGTVYRGQQEYLDRAVAVKVLAPTFRHPQFVDRFRREARTLANLAHPNIVTCYQAGVTDDGQCYLVMELITGPSLRAQLDDRGALSVAAALRLARDLASALAHAQDSGVVHRDVKPENVLLEPWPQSPEPEFPWRARLADLGLARPFGAGRGPTLATAVGTVLGTPSTMAPEQFDAPENVDHRADIYGLGCVLYHALTGQSAFDDERMTEMMTRKAAKLGPDPRQHATRLPAELAMLVRRMLASAPADRPQSYGELTGELERIARSLPIEREATPTRWRAAVTAVVSAVVLGGIALAIWWPGADAQPELPPQPIAPAARGDWQPTRDVDLFAAGNEPFATWQCLGGQPGSDENGTPTLNRRAGLALVVRPLVAGNFELAGALEPRGRFQDPDRPPTPVSRAGIRLCIGPELAVELELRPTADQDCYAASLHWARPATTGAGEWARTDVIATLDPAITTAGGKLPFRVTWRDEQLAFEFGDGPARTERLQPGQRQPGAVPDALAVFTEGGLVVLPGMRLRQ